MASQHHAQITSDSNGVHSAASAAAVVAAAATAASSNTQVETKGQDLQHAVDFYQKGMEIAHSATTHNDYCRAIEHLSLAIAIRNMQPRFFLARGNAFRSINEYEHALQDLSVCLSQAPGNDIFRFHGGIWYMERGRYADAIPDLHAAANANPHDTKFYHIGLSCALENHNIDAIENFTAALEHSTDLEPFNDGASDELVLPSSKLLSTQLLYIHERAKALQLEKYYEEAIDDFNFVIQHNPNNAHAYFRRAFAHKALGHLHEAASDFETAKLLDPTNLQLVVNYKEIRDTDWIYPSEHGYDKDGKRSKTVLLDEENAWFEQDTMPLVSARYDNDDIGSDCVVTKTVVMRSPRATFAVATPSGLKSPTSKTAAQREASKTTGSSGSSGRPSKLTKPPSRGLVCIDKSDDENESHARAAHVQSKRKESHEERHAERSSSVESVGSHGSMSSQSSFSSLTASSNYVVVQQDETAETGEHYREESARRVHDDDDRETSQPSSPKSPSKGSKTPGSPKKPRYGRKNYRANFGRKKTE